MKSRFYLLLAAICGTVVAYAVAAPPVVFQALDPVHPGETLLLFGAGISAQATAVGYRLDDDPVTGPPAACAESAAGKPNPLEMLQATDLSAKVLVPDSWRTGIYAVQVRNANGHGNWQFINRPQVWWQVSGVDGKVRPGGHLRIFGKNLGPVPRVWISGRSGSIELAVKSAGDNETRASLPAGIAPGKYRLWLHNGYGGVAGFGAPLNLEIASLDPWSPRVYNVHDFGAKGGNESDDTFAIRRALEWAGKQGGGIVYLPRGTYIITGKLRIPRRTILRGESRASVWLKVPEFWPKRPQKLAEFDAVITGNGDFGVEDLSIVAQPVQRLVVAPDTPTLYGQGMARRAPVLLFANNVHLHRLRLWHLYFANRVADADPAKRASEGPSTIVVNGADFSLEDSEVISAGMPIQIFGATRATIARNSLRTGRDGWYGLWDFRDGIFEQNDISAGDLGGSSGAVQGVATHVIFSRNRWHGAFGGEREALTFDSPYFPVWMGAVLAQGRQLVLDKRVGGQGDLAQSPPENLLAVIAAGKGLGQVREVTSVSDEMVELDRPFDIPLGNDTIVVLGTKKFQVLVLDNAIEDASVAVQLYSQSCDFLVTRNYCERTGGSYAHAHDSLDGEKRRRYSYALFNQWIQNTFSQGLVFDQGPWRDAYVGYSSFRSPGFTRTTPAIGQRFVGNRLLGGTTMGAANVPALAPQQLGNGAAPLARDAIFERNTILDQNVGIAIDPGHWFTLLRGNRTERVSEPVKNLGTQTLEE